NPAPSDDSLVLQGDISLQDLEAYWATDNDLLIKVNPADGAAWNDRDGNIEMVLTYYNNRSPYERVQNEDGSWSNLYRPMETKDLEGFSDKALRHLAYQIDTNESVSALSLNEIVSIQSYLQGLSQQSTLFEEYRSEADSILIEQFYDSRYSIENIILDGENVTLNNNDIMDIMSTDSSEMIRGVDWADNTINAKAGNDVVVGGVLNDTISGNSGSDILQGRTGDDSYQFGKGDGHDVLYDGPDQLNQVVESVRYWFGRPSSDSSVQSGEIWATGPGTMSIDYWHFHHNGGALTIDLLSEDSDSNSIFVDIDGDGTQTALDTYVQLFRADGELDSSDYIDDNDDGDYNDGSGDGSLSDYDSYLSFEPGALVAGDYVLAVSGYSLDVEEAVSGINNDSGNGPYQITFTGDCELTDGFQPYNDVIGSLTPGTDAGGYDTVSFGSGIFVQDVSFARYGQGGLYVGYGEIIQPDDNAGSIVDLLGDAADFNYLSGVGFGSGTKEHVYADDIVLPEQNISGRGIEEFILENHSSITKEDIVAGLNESMEYIDTNYAYLETIQNSGRDAKGYVDQILLNKWQRIDHNYIGTAAADSIVSGDGDDIIIAHQGDDIIDAGFGSDAIDGGVGDDTYIYHRWDGSDTIIDAGGIDTLQFGSGIRLSDLVATIDAVSGNLTLGIIDEVEKNAAMAAGSPYEPEASALSQKIILTNWHAESTRIEVFSFADGSVLSAMNLYNHFFASEGDDVIFGLEGDNVIAAKGGNDTITLAAGNHIVDAGYGRDNITTASGDDVIYTGEGADTVYSGAGNDTINTLGEGNHVTGGAGDDILNGGTGSDHYHFGLGSGHDWVL
ncbi:MAG: hypothetical protein DRH06_11335, partial [Deltaproteobacteria bacterium]